jgi:hypothetical protein
MQNNKPNEKREQTKTRETKEKTERIRQCTARLKNCIDAIYAEKEIKKRNTIQSLKITSRFRKKESPS